MNVAPRVVMVQNPNHGATVAIRFQCDDFRFLKHRVISHSAGRYFRKLWMDFVYPPTRMQQAARSVSEDRRVQPQQCRVRPMQPQQCARAITTQRLRRVEEIGHWLNHVRSAATCGVNDRDQGARPFETCSVVGIAGAGSTLVPGISACKGGPNKAKSRPPTSLGRVPVEPGSDQLELARQDHSGSLGVGHSQSSPVTPPGHSSLVSPDGCHGQDEDFLLITPHCQLPTACASTSPVPVPAVIRKPATFKSL